MAPEPARRSGPLARVAAGVRLAASTFTVLPVRAAPADRPIAGMAMAIGPVFGAAIGGLQAVVAVGLHRLAAPGLLCGVAAVGCGALVTRGLHLDGLADTVDGLGSYTDRQRALEIMKAPDIGPFGVAAIVFDLITQSAAIGGLAQRPWLAAGCGLAAAGAVGRLAAGYGCRHGVPAARADGMGALVSGTVGWPALVQATLMVAGLSVLAVPGRPYQGPICVAAALGAAVILVRHAVRRLGGITGDVLGALIETSTVIALAGLSLGG